jgi:RNA polymerase sigma factor (sigma-70 family)
MIKRKINSAEKEQYDEILYWQQLKEGERSGLEGLYIRFSRELFKYGMAVQADRSLVKDCIQELFIDLWKYRKSLKNTSNVKLYLCKSLAYRIFRELHLEKRRKEQNPLEVYESLYSSQNRQMEDEEIGKLRNVLGNLPVRQREIIQYVFFDKLSSEEISERMGIAVQSVYTLTWKAIGTLKKSFLLMLYVLFIS